MSIELGFMIACPLLTTRVNILTLTINKLLPVSAGGTFTTLSGSDYYKCNDFISTVYSIIVKLALLRTAFSFFQFVLIHLELLSQH